MISSDTQFYEEDDGRDIRYSIYLNGQIVGRFMQPAYWLPVAAAAGASVLHFVDTPYPGTGICTVTYDGTLLAHHSLATAFESCQTLTSGWQDGSLLVIAKTGDTLSVCSAGGQLQAISLDRPAAKPHEIHLRVSSCGGMAAICIMGQQPEVLLVDLARQRVTQRHGLPGAAGWPSHFQLAQGSRSLAVSSAHKQYMLEIQDVHTQVIPTAGSGAGFIIPGACSPCWDPLGRFLAVLTSTGVSVYSASGTHLAYMSGLPKCGLIDRLRWQPESSGLTWEDRGDHGNTKWLLKF